MELRKTSRGFPYIPASVTVLRNGVRYLTSPGVAVFAKTEADLSVMHDFLSGFPAECKFQQYLDDPTPLADPDLVAMTAGQLCYMSFGVGHTPHSKATGYFMGIKNQGHGSILEHATVMFLCYGISRSVSHELVRHRAGFAFSQVSQRYVDELILRSILRPEFSDDPDLLKRAQRKFRSARTEYVAIRERLRALEEQRGIHPTTRDERREQRKRLQQAARAVLPNQTEAPIFVTANWRAWRHFVEMRASRHAEVEIRELAMRIFFCLRELAPEIMGDYSVEELPDGSHELITPFRKV